MATRCGKKKVWYQFIINIYTASQRFLHTVRVCTRTASPNTPADKLKLVAWPPPSPGLNLIELVWEEPDEKDPGKAANGATSLCKCSRSVGVNFLSSI